jgi:hypothetical protein
MKRMKLCGALAIGAVLSTTLACAGEQQAIGTKSTVLSTKPSIYLRVTPDGDASEIIGAFIPDEVLEGDVDESMAVRTRCSKFITAKRVPASGQYQEVAAASSGASARLGVKSLAKVELGGQSSEALLVRYQLIEKMQADVDEDNLQRCCETAPDQCSKRYISGALMADGNYYAATAFGSNGTADAEALRVAELPVDANVVYESEMKWERKVNFKRQYFAFNVRRGLAGGLGATGVADDCSWTKKIPSDLDGSYFVGVSNPMLSEKEARTDALRDAKEQVIRYLGEYLAEGSLTVTKTVGNTADLQTLMDDTRVKESMSGGVARAVKDRNWCGPEEQASPSGMRQVMKVLAYFPNSERDAASVLALQTIIAQQKAAGRDVASLEAMLKKLQETK